MTPDLQALRSGLADRASELGFEAFGITHLPAEVRGDYYRRWIAEGQHGTMAWMARQPEKREDPRKILPEARSVIMLGLNYYQPEPERGYRIAKYALGKDYHKLIYKRLKHLCSYLRENAGSEQKPYVDTGPVLEKPFAQAAGIGWQGKSTIVIHRPLGTWLFLGTILTTAELPADNPPRDHCGSCTRCLEACPTGAITAPYQLDARRCISYLTIEHEGPIPLEFRTAIGDRVFGCDDCLDVCPWNRWARQTRELRFAPVPYPPLLEMLRWSEDDFSEATAGTAIRRTGLRNWKRNVLVVLGNTGTRKDLLALQPFRDGDDSLLAEHAEWAIQRIEQRTGN
ncbi:MAG: tRNA epoxyqueuosine(34) reductase QueG [Opitutales bacterium]